jgi:hypothetical protein
MGGFSDINGESPVGATFEAIADETVATNNHFINLWPDYTSNAGEPIGVTFGDNFTTGTVVPEGIGASGTDLIPIR